MKKLLPWIVGLGLLWLAFNTPSEDKMADAAVPMFPPEGATPEEMLEWAEQNDSLEQDKRHHSRGIFCAQHPDMC